MALAIYHSIDTYILPPAFFSFQVLFTYLPPTAALATNDMKEPLQNTNYPTKTRHVHFTGPAEDLELRIT